MPSTLHRLFGLVLVLAALSSSNARGQAAFPPPLYPYRVQAPAVVVPTLTTFSVQTTLVVPDRGTATLGSYSHLAEGRVEHGPPALGHLPYVGRGFRNVGYGRSVLSARASVSVRVIDLREEEERQTGYRSR